jgi:hypothetical protein
LGNLWVVGEADNNLSQPAGLVEITAYFYSANNQLLTTEFGFACLDTTPAFGDSPYTVLLISPPVGIDHVQIAVTNYFLPPLAAAVPVGLTTSGLSTNVDFINYLHVTGNVTNLSANTYDFVQPCVAFYDSSGQVIRTDFTYTSPDTLGPSQTGSFDSSVDYAPSITSYRVWVNATYQ